MAEEVRTKLRDADENKIIATNIQSSSEKEEINFHLRKAYLPICMNWPYNVWILL